MHTSVSDPKGGEMRLSTHDVITLKKGLEWYSALKEDQLPIKVTTQTTSDGRMHVGIRDCGDKLIHMRG